MKKILYLIPLEGYGGVEVAAQTLTNIDEKNFKFVLKYIFENRKEIFNIKKILNSYKKVLQHDPNILIVSLWRAALIGFLVKLIKPKINLILFIHSEKDTHFFDFLFTRLAFILSNEVWFDSYASSKNRFKYLIKKEKKHIISFSVRKIKKKLYSIKNEPNFIYWGRISKEKGLYRSLEIFEGILKYFPKATYKIIGSFEYGYHEIKKYCEDRKLYDSVKFFDEMKFEEIKTHADSASYYLQTSQFEGFALSVVESMILGLVPVVTPVGEIEKYCNNKNSIIVYSNMEAIRDVIVVLRNNNYFESLRTHAIKTWSNQLYFKDSFVENCQRLIKS